LRYSPISSVSDFIEHFKVNNEKVQD